ncbi:uncharacterized protein LOC142541327 [Primulina tabacum]|uniref:uncharacterized protein LOC142541327 n=1 Tax=Primulina tabacum TaxID=48773 RepID=UPI003F59C055
MEYPRTKIGEQYRRFQKGWFEQFPWLEYSPNIDAAFCFPCTRYAAFTVDGFRVMNAQTLEEVKKNCLRLTSTIESIYWLCLQGCALRGNDESSYSKNQEKAPKNAKYTSRYIQKEILHILAERVRKKIREEVGSSKLCLLIDEAKDISDKEQMTIVLRFFDREGFFMERFFDIVHVSDTTAVTLKKEICNVLGRHDLHIKDIRG